MLSPPACVKRPLYQYVIELTLEEAVPRLGFVLCHSTPMQRQIGVLDAVACNCI